MSARIAHVEIAGKDGEKLEGFYTALFGWEVTRRPTADFPYGDVHGATPEGMTAGVRHEPDGCAEVVLYVEVEDVDAAFARACELGAEPRLPPMRHGDLHFALVTDPEGNPVGLVEAKREG